MVRPGAVPGAAINGRVQGGHGGFTRVFTLTRARRAFVAAIALALVAVLPSAASASTLTGYESTLGGAPYAGDPYVFWSGTDAGLWQIYWDGTVWHAPAEVPGTAGSLTSAPTAVTFDSDLDVFWRGSDGGLDEAWWNDSSWTGPVEIPGTAGSLTSAPTAEEDGLAVEVYWRGTDGGLDEAVWDGSWTGPDEVPATAGSLTSAPSAEQDGSAAVEIYWQDSDGGLDEVTWDGSWAGPAEVPGTPGTVASAPSAQQDGSTSEVYWRTSGGGVDESWWDGSWGGPAEVPGSASSTASTGPGKTGSPVTVTLPVPSVPSSGKTGKKRKVRRVRTGFTISWQWNGDHTRLVAMHVRNRPRSGSISVACAGRGCSWHKLKATHRSVPRLLRSLARRMLRAGDRLTITASAPGMRSEQIEVRIRDGAEPKARLL